ncbi:MAG: pantoate kinase [Candidatus Thorarchaeota archaeon]
MTDTLTTRPEAVMTAKAFVPGHVTGIFRIFDEYDDPLRCGSTGAGFSVKVGTETSVSVMEHSSLEIATDYNSERIDAQVTKTVVRRLTEEYERTLKVHVTHESSLPSGAGFGASGAGALGAALALGHILDQDINYEQAAEVAHIAEISNHTGLGDVLAQTVGGIEVRVVPGGPGVGKIENILYLDSLRAVFAGAPGLKTAEILTNPETREKINTIGDHLVERIIADPTIETFMECSRTFSDELGLKTPRVKEALDELERTGLVDASMVMLGDSVFCLCEKDEAYVAQRILSKYWGSEEVTVSEIASEGGRLVN